ncbi:nuclear transport factor 2 family protein [Streptomyces sp. KR55]|uniref:nuclear transport factor 2 family protein n=1 Tax=Streptomyces sp. KR55 TaxID=3457425 RepID=UPI003FD24DA0
MTDHNSPMDIHTLIHRYFRALDVRDFAPDWMRPFVTPDVRLEAPVGVEEGIEAATRLTEEALGRFTRTQHMASGLLVDVDGERGTASWNALMTHVYDDDTLFTVGSRCEADLRRTPNDWRFSRVAVRPVWAQGPPPVVRQR